MHLEDFPDLMGAAVRVERMEISLPAREQYRIGQRVDSASGIRPLPKGRVPVSRNAPCQVNGLTQEPCAFTDGSLAEQTVQGFQELTLDLGQARALTWVLFRGRHSFLGPEAVLEGSTDGVTWIELVRLAPQGGSQPAFELKRLPDASVRYVRLSSPPAGYSTDLSLREVSLFDE